MTPPFSVHTTPHFDRSLKKLIKRHPNLGDRYAEAIEILNIDPQNLSRTHNIRKLEGVQPGEGPYRFRRPLAIPLRHFWSRGVALPMQSPTRGDLPLRSTSRVALLLVRGL